MTRDEVVHLEPITYRTVIGGVRGPGESLTPHRWSKGLLVRLTVDAVGLHWRRLVTQRRELDVVTVPWEAIDGFTGALPGGVLASGWTWLGIELSKPVVLALERQGWITSRSDRWPGQVVWHRAGDRVVWPRSWGEDLRVERSSAP